MTPDAKETRKRSLPEAPTSQPQQPAVAPPHSDILPPPGHESSLFFDVNHHLPGFASIGDSTTTGGAVAPPPPSSSQQGRLYRLRHGSSLSLMSAVCTFLADPDHDDAFNYIDPTNDHGKWAERGLCLYYAALVDPSTDEVVCALRAVTDGLASAAAEEEKPGGSRRDEKRQAPPLFVIDYVYTAQSRRGCGLADGIVNFALNTASVLGAETFVLSLEESCVYWMEKFGFFLCRDAALNERLNVFPDTHLLRRGGDPSLAADDAREQGVSDDRRENEKLVDDRSDLGGAASSRTGPTLPHEFTSALATILSLQEPPRSDRIRLCLTTLALLLKNAIEAPPGGRRRTFKIENPAVRERVFAVSDVGSMELLLACGFELGVEEGSGGDDDDGAAEAGDGATVMTYRGARGEGLWLPLAIEQLEREAKD